jgi:hypothetical protein
MEEEVARIIRCLKSGLSSIIVITGTDNQMLEFREILMDRLATEARPTTLLDLTADKQSFTPTENTQDLGLLIVWGLERLSPQVNRTYAIRTFLDIEQYRGLKSIIFCEHAAYKPHFVAYTAPFYQFCPWFPIGGIEIAK